ncbi:uncharacterized protein LDX57_002059 [Aspergillus melleus]|uniref:uncharacterized protein n=1 Tax=Aspergillus melleus TaxID=138277 RepID=UPI001E8ECF97|nr:uncharacterized protein LDX57_002059 [Aspergillus melleus]KAH8424307.1 hypothetical protein LDX57_002059 [Aspergillus melleus]
MVRFMVTEGQADVNMQLRHSGYGSVLARSAGFGLLEVTRYLLEEGGADVDLILQHGNYGSALACAVSHGRDHFLRGELLDYLVRVRRANVDLPLQTGRYGSALAAAASKGEMDFVEYLIEIGEADVNMPLQAGYYGSALAAAVTEGHLDYFPCGSALAIAAYMANERPKDGFAKTHVRIDIVRVLLEAGALVALDLGNGETADALEAFNEGFNGATIYGEDISDGNGDDLYDEDLEDLEKSLPRRLVRLRKKLKEHSVLHHVQETRDY